MDDPFGPIIIIVIAFLLACIVRVAEAAIPYIDDGEETRRQAEGGSTKARRTLRLIQRHGKAPSEFRMVWAFLALVAWVALYYRLSRNMPVPAGTTGTPVPAWLLLKLATPIRLLLFTLAAFTLADVIPCRLAAHFRQRLFDRAAPIAEWTLILLSPITRLSMLLGMLILKPFHLSNPDSSELVTEEDIMEMVDIGEEKGAIEADEREMIENIFEFNNMDAADCMIHRKDITAIDIESADAEIMDAIRESGRSRIPVYEDSIDNVLGILITRDYLVDKCEGRGTPLRQLIRPAHFVPESVRTDVLFKEMQTRKQHIAIVVDEYGGTSGLITLEDLLEEIVGNIYDEYDLKEDEDIQPLPDGRWRISGSAELEAIAEALGIELPVDEEFDTLGGLVFSQLTEIPADGQRPVVACFGLRISVETIADRRVEWAIVEKIDSESIPEDKQSAEAGGM